MSIIVLPISYYESATLNQKIAELTGPVLIDVRRDERTVNLFNDYNNGNLTPEDFLKKMNFIVPAIEQLVLSNKAKLYPIGDPGEDTYGNNLPEVNERINSNITRILTDLKTDQAPLLIKDKSNFIEYLQKGRVVEEIHVSTHPLLFYK